MSAKAWCAACVFATTCLPVLFLSPFPTQDGPAHLYSGHAAAHLGDPHYRAINHFFEPSAAALSTRTVERLFSVLVGLVGPIWAEKLVVLLFICCLFSVFLVERETSLLFPLCALPLLTYTFVLRMGFYSFCLAIPLALYAVSFWTHRPAVPTLRRLILTGGCLAALPFFHLVAAGWALVLGWSAAGALALVERRMNVRVLAALALASMPLLLAVTSYPTSSEPYVWERIGTRAAALVVGGAFLGQERYASILGAVPSVMLLALTALFLREEGYAWRTGNRSALCRIVAVFAALTLALIVPEEAAGGAYIGVRCNLLFFLLLLIVLRHWRLPAPVDAAFAAFFFVFSLARVLSICATLQTASAAQRAILESRTFLQDHATVLVVVAGEWVDAPAPDLSTQVRPLLHAGDLLGVGADRAVLTFYQGDIPYFPLNFKKSANPFGALFDSALFGWEMPAVRWDALPAWQGGVDYLAVWDEERILRSAPTGVHYRNAVCASYEEVHRSRTWPWVMYRLRRGSDGEHAAPAMCSTGDRHATRAGTLRIGGS